MCFLWTKIDDTFKMGKWRRDDRQIPCWNWRLQLLWDRNRKCNWRMCVLEFWPTGSTECHNGWLPDWQSFYGTRSRALGLIDGGGWWSNNVPTEACQDGGERVRGWRQISTCAVLKFTFPQFQLHRFTGLRLLPVLVHWAPSWSRSLLSGLTAEQTNEQCCMCSMNMCTRWC